MGRRLSQLCPPYATPSSNSSLDYRRSDARIAKNGFATSGVLTKSATVVLIPYLARRLGRPVKWIEDRLEHILNAAHARDDRHEVEIAFDAEGRILAIRDRLLKDSGAY